LELVGIVAERRQVMQTCSEHCVTTSKLFAHKMCSAVLSRISMKKLLPGIPTVFGPLFVLRVFQISVMCKKYCTSLERLFIDTVYFCTCIILFVVYIHFVPFSGIIHFRCCRSFVSMCLRWQKIK